MIRHPDRRHDRVYNRRNFVNPQTIIYYESIFLKSIEISTFKIDHRWDTSPSYKAYHTLVLECHADYTELKSQSINCILKQDNPGIKSMYIL